MVNNTRIHLIESETNHIWNEIFNKFTSAIELDKDDSDEEVST